MKSQFGYHILKLEEIQAGEAKPFADVRAELDSQYRQERAADLFGERQEQMSARLEKGTSDIDKVAEDLSLTRGSIAEFLRGGGAEPLGSSVDLQQTVFSDATLNQGKIGGPVALGEDRLVLVKVTKHRKAEVKPLADVHAEIVDAAEAGTRSRGCQGRRRGGGRQADRGREARCARQVVQGARGTRALREPRRSVDTGGIAHRDFRSAASDGDAGRSQRGPR